MRVTAAVAAVVLLGVRAGGAEFHVSPDGKAGGDGSQAAPWNLQTALASPAVKAGDTVWLHGGTYKGRFDCALAGERDRPITVRQAPGERAVIDCVPVAGQKQPPFFEIAGVSHDVVFWGIEVTCSEAKRVTEIKGPWPEDIQRGGVNCRGSRIKFINMIVHDTAGGFSLWAEGEGGEVYGCLIYYNGWQGPDRGHGHGIYTQNKAGTKRIVDNIIFGQFSHGVHAYGSSKAFLSGYQIEGNACFNNGALARDGARAPDVLVGGACPAERISVVDNVMYQDGGNTALRLGYVAENRDLTARGNFVVGFADFKGWTTAEVKGNTFVSPATLVGLGLPTGVEPKSYAWDDNTFVRTKAQWSAFALRRGGKTEGPGWKEWQALGIDGRSTYREGPARGVHVVVRPNAYEPGRGHVIVVNFDRHEKVKVELPKILKVGEAFEVLAANEYFGAPVVEGVYRGSVEIPMGGGKVAEPVGQTPGKLVRTSEFGAFVVRRK